MKEIVRKCGLCDYDKHGKSLGNEIKSINLETDDYLKSDGKFYHTDCFIKKEQSRKKNRLSDYQIQLLVIKTKDKNKLELQKIVDADRLAYWLYDCYEVTVLPSSFFNKLKSINDGSYKGLKEGIDNESILNIFIKMKLYLDKNAESLKNKGRGFKGVTERINYDLSVIINNYDKYKVWKKEQESQTLRNVEQDNYVEKKQLFDNKIKNIDNRSKNDEIDIVSLIDELF